jgi:transcriptional regulator with XRE-family HTH domain
MMPSNAANALPPANTAVAGPPGIGRLLRMARQARGWSQLELSLQLDISQRHVSFVEIGRSRPSRQLIIDWTTATTAAGPLRDAALQLAGFAPPRHWAPSPAADALLRDPLRCLMAADSDMPLVLFDDDWRLMGINAAGEWLAPMLMNEYLLRREGQCVGTDMLDAVASEGGLLSSSCNGADAAASLIAQVERESWFRPALAARADALRESVARRYGTAALKSADTATERCFAFATPLGGMAFHPMQTDYPQAGGGRVRLEIWVPANEQTRAAMRRRCAEAA